jgi:hypothetical protein
VVVLLLGGCSTIREDVGQPLRVDDRALEGATDYHAVLDAFGPPHRLSIGDTGMVFLYEELDLFELQAGLNLSGKRAALFKAVMARGTAERRVLIASFDSRGNTQAIRYLEGEEAAARGAALQFVFAVAGVVDDDDLSRPPFIHEWGFGLLEADLPCALNRGQSLETGNHGIEQQATPTAVGQHALELQ